MRCEKDVVLFIRDERVLLLLSALYDATIHPPKREGEERTSKEEKREEHHASSLYVEASSLIFFPSPTIIHANTSYGLFGFPIWREKGLESSCHSWNCVNAKLIQISWIHEARTWDILISN